MECQNCSRVYLKKVNFEFAMFHASWTNKLADQIGRIMDSLLNRPGCGKFPESAAYSQIRQF